MRLCEAGERAGKRRYRAVDLRIARLLGARRRLRSNLVVLLGDARLADALDWAVEDAAVMLLPFAHGLEGRAMRVISTNVRSVRMDEWDEQRWCCRSALEDS